jgi:hypothetical protein
MGEKGSGISPLNARKTGAVNWRIRQECRDFREIITVVVRSCIALAADYGR